MRKIVYPIPEKIVEYNILVLNTIKVKKADKAEVLNRYAILHIISDCKKLEGSIYDNMIKRFFCLNN